MADDEKIIKVILAQPETTRFEKTFGIIVFIVIAYQILFPEKPRRRG